MTRISAPTVVGIANFGPHPALQDAINGFKAEMAKNGYEEGRNVRYVMADANFSPAMIPQVLNQIEANKPAVILTVTTPVTLMLLARAALYRDRVEGNPETPPDTGQERPANPAEKA